jgi:hypothetical protein
MCGRARRQAMSESAYLHMIAKPGFVGEMQS